MVVRGAKAPKLYAELVPLVGVASLQMMLQGVAVLWKKPVEKPGNGGSKLAIASAENLMQARRIVGLIGYDVPVPQPNACSPRGESVTLLAFPELCLGNLQLSNIANGADET